MRMRDRRAILAIPVLAVAYLALVAWGAALLLHWAGASDLPPPSEAMRRLLGLNLLLLGWRMVVRWTMVARSYGAREAWRSLPRLFVANLVALLAARRAAVRYVASLRDGRLAWDKTAHHFPDMAGLPER